MSEFSTVVSTVRLCLTTVILLLLNNSHFGFHGLIANTNLALGHVQTSFGSFVLLFLPYFFSFFLSYSSPFCLFSLAVFTI